MSAVTGMGWRPSAVVRVVVYSRVTLQSVQ